MASNYDIAFLRVLMQQALAERAQAMRCLQVIDEQAQRGQAVNAMQVVVRLGLCDARQAERIDALAREELSRSGASGSGLASTSFRGSASQSGFQSGSGVAPPPRPAPLGPPPPMPGVGPGPAPAPSGAFPRVATTSQTLPPGYARPLSTPGAGVALPPSQAGATAPPPPAAPLGGPPPTPAPLPRPAPPPGLPPGVSTAPIPRALTGEETVAGADLTFTRPPGSPSLEALGEGGGEELYDLAENGQGLDDFFSGAKLGRGPVGTSYEGKRKSDGAPVVVKVLSRRFAQHPDLLAQVLEDVGAWSGLRHPNLASALAVGVSNERHVIVLAHAPGQALEQHVRERGRLEPRAAMRVVYELAQALAAAQERGLSHGDVRPAKVYFDGQHARLADPGLARAACLAAGFGQHGLAFGHPTYLAPEVLQEHLDRPTPAADVYALGVLFYELVCGVPPFQGTTAEVLGKHFDAPLPPPPQGVSFSAAIAGLMLRMTAKSPSQRLPDARAVVSAITNLLEGKPPGPIPGRGGQARSPGAAISVDEWGRASQREDHKGISNHAWTVSRIEHAPAVGPADLGEPGALVSDVSGSGLRAASTTGRLPREVVDEAALLAQAPGAARVGEKLGRGPVGTSYEGALPNQAAPVVVKVLSKKFSKHPDLVRRVLEGVRAAAAFNHPGVVRAIKALQVGGRDMLVLERAQGRTLREVLAARGRLPWRQATTRVLELARTLEAARRHGLSHGDIRPEKVFVDDAGRARLADFGLAEAACLGAGFGAAGMAFGHPGYLAPEMVQEGRREPDERGDVYALGILYYELICGRAPFQSNDPKRTLVQHFESPLPPPPEQVTVPSVVAELILRMTAKDPARRLGSMAELARRLEQTETAASQDAGEVLPPRADPVGGAARPSGIGPKLEYDPGEDDMVSPDAWGNQSLELARPSGEWVKEKIADAPKVGPDEWTPDSSDLDDPSDGPGPAPPPPPAGTSSVPKDTLAAAIQAAAVTRESTPEAAAPPVGKPGESARTSKKRQAGSVRASKAAPGAPEGGNKRQFALAVGGIVLTLLVMLVLVLRGGDPQVVKTDDGAGGGNGGGTIAPPPPPVEDPLIARREALLKRLDKELKDTALDVEDLLRSQRFKDAAERLNGLSADARKEPAVQAQISELEGRVRQGASERLARELGEIDALVAKRDLDRARRLAMTVGQWAPDPAMAQQAQQRVMEQNRLYHRPVEALALEQAIDMATVEGLLRERVRGWGEGGTLFARGGVVVEWTRPDLLLEDLEVVKGKATVEGLPDGRGALRVVGTKQAPAFVVSKVPLTRLVDATLDLVLAVQPGGQAGLIMGARPPQPARGFGVAWGIMPVELSPLGLKPMRTMALPTLPLHAPLRMRLAMSGDNRLGMSGTLWVAGDQQPGAVVALDAGRTAGRLALWVEDAEVWITGLELRGLLDPAGLR